MARWRLTAAHYLRTEGIEWVYNEVDRTTGRPKRRSFQVPQYLNPDDPGDWNYRYNQDAGEIIVCQGTGEDRDIQFFGDPTPDMVPLDDEAKAISASFADKWKHPIDSLSGTYGDRLVEDFQTELAAVQAAQNKPAQIDGMTELLSAMSEMMKQNQQLIASLATRRV